MAQGDLAERAVRFVEEATEGRDLLMAICPPQEVESDEHGDYSIKPDSILVDSMLPSHPEAGSW